MRLHIEDRRSMENRARYGSDTKKAAQGKKAEIIEVEICPDHIRSLVSITPNASVS